MGASATTSRFTPSDALFQNDALDTEQRIAAAHQRSACYGLAPADAPDFSDPGRSLLLQALEENRFLFHHAEPVMETLFGQIANTHSMVLLTSSKGMVLHSLGDNDFLEKASLVALTPGMDWSERHKGTNAIGTALSEGEALTVHGGQHFMDANKFLTCSCAPIVDPMGEIIGALDVTGDQRSHHQHTLALVRMSAQMIENHMFADIFPKAIRLHFHSRPEFLGTLVEGIAVFSTEGRFLSANRSAQFQLGLPFSALRAHTFSSLFGQSISALIERTSRHSSAQTQALVLHNGVSVWCRVKMKTAPNWAMNGHSHQTAEAHTGAQPGPRGSEAPAPSGQTIRSAPAFSNAPPTTSKSPFGTAKMLLSSLQYLDTGDPQVAQVIQKMRLVCDRDIPVMILGETGTGKDLLVQAFHNDSRRAGMPFVSVNCASIPDTLIESELFGYEEGAFTGARKKGATGKILQAHGGTLFLDEIGDMPKHLQARLLRVLQERKVSPLGAAREIDVDVAVVCATHKNLKSMLASGEFREDLYYRLNGLVVKLPALRERTDFDAVVQKILLSLCENGRSVSIAPSVMSLFKSYAWPGNFRQLHNLLRTAVIMAGCEGTIQERHLPDDFWDEVGMPAHSGPISAAGNAQAQDSGDSLQDVTLGAMAQMLRQHRGNVSAAAKALGVSRNTIYRKKDLLPAGLLQR